MSYENVIQIAPQPGPQTAFLKSIADIVIYGGAAGGGKTWSVLFEVLRNISNSRFNFVGLRRTINQITKPGAMWDESKEMYMLVNGKPKEMGHRWEFPSGANGQFSGMQYENDKYDFHGSQVCYIFFDQLEQFTGTMFFFMLARNRSICGVKPYIRATANPEPGWLADFLDWWIAEDGYADMSRAGKLRWLVRDGESILWRDTEAEAVDIFGRNPDGSAVNPPKSVTFIPATVYDNKKLLAADPSYLANLMALPATERKRLLGDKIRGGNWRVKPGGTRFKREWFSVVDDYPKECKQVRYWDLAATEPKKGKDPDWTVGVRVGLHDGIWYIIDVQRDRLTPKGVEDLLAVTKEVDGPGIPVRVEMEGGSSGKIVIDNYRRNIFVGHDFDGKSVSVSKEVRANPVSRAAEAGNIRIVRGSWNQAYFDELQGFSPECDHDDQVDATSGAFAYLSLESIDPSVSDGVQHPIEKKIEKELQAMLDEMSPEERVEAQRLRIEMGT